MAKLTRKQLIKRKLKSKYLRMYFFDTTVFNRMKTKHRGTLNEPKHESLLAELRYLENKSSKCSRRWEKCCSKIERFYDKRKQKRLHAKLRNSKYETNKVDATYYYFDWKEYPNLRRVLFSRLIRWEIVSNYYKKRLNDLINSLDF